MNTKRGIQVKDQWTECEIVRSHDALGPVKVARAMTVPASSDFVFTGSCSVKSDDEVQTFDFEASENAKQHLLVASGLAHPKIVTVAVKLINQRPAKLRLKKGLLKPPSNVYCWPSQGGSSVLVLW